MPKYWAVNQGKTYIDEISGGFLWAPITNKAKVKLQIYTNVTLVKKGDIVFSLVKGNLYAIGVCIEEYKNFENPLKNHKDDWIKDGWLIKVDFKELDVKPVIKQHIEEIRDLLPTKYSPLLKNGNAPQQGYLSSISDELANVFIKLTGNQYTINSSSFEILEEGIKGRTDIGYTVKQQLVNSRRGQGQFKQNVIQNEKCCRITGIADTRFLIASHIKPWSKCSDEEKLDGCNGFMLSPNVDKLFDRGFISFSNDGNIIVSPQININILSAMGIDIHKNVGKFNKKQLEYLEYHQKNVFIN